MTTPRKPTTYTVIYERDAGGFWLARVRGLTGCHTQGRTITQARDRIREALSLYDDGASQALLRDDVRLPADVKRLLGAHRSARVKKQSVEAKLHDLSVKAAHALTRKVGLSLRDAGELLGASQESVRQWVDVEKQTPVNR
jgi:predicted RNase H-like HicB family nuclease